MVKIKNVPHTTPRPGTPRVATAGASPRRNVRKNSKKSASGVGFLFGLAGWVAVLGTLLAVILTVKRQQQESVRIRNSISERTKEIQASVLPRQEEISNRKKQLEKEINASIKRQEQLISDIEGLKLTNKGLQPEANSLETTHRKLSQSVVAIKDDANVTVEGLQDLADRLQKLEAKRADMKEEYRRRFEIMKTEFEEKKARSEPEMLRQFYGSNRHTVFAPAAGVFAAEKLYAGKRSKDALRLYKDVLRRFPDSAYSEECRSRIAEIEAGAPFKEQDAPLAFHPYHSYATGKSE